ncbi:MAG: hypothetical protein EAY75_03815 [Bacteroidetes bacterium]|nr:MAG: hypothetical protein EAY75_03815 [Bacteroidota bacterium]
MGYQKYSFAFFLIFSLMMQTRGFAQQQETPPVADTNKPVAPLYVDTALRIVNLNPYFTLHVDSSLNYDLHVNKDTATYFWYLRNSPVGVKIDKNTGLLSFKAEKAFFKSGRLKYDQEYRIQLGVQNLLNPKEKVDTGFIIVFYSTEIIASRLKPTVNSTLFVEEGDSIQFKVQCESGSFPFEQITLTTSVPISAYVSPTACNDWFRWWIPFDFIKDGDTTKQKNVVLQMIAADKFFNRDTVKISVWVRPGINYPQKYAEHKRVSDDVLKYVVDLKLTFYTLSKAIKSNKSTRTTFDITSSTTALAGTVLSTTSDNQSTENFGKVLPSIGLTLVPVKEAVAPNKIREQNTASQVRAMAKKMEYLVGDNALVGDRDPDILAKTKKLQDELRQARVQLIDLDMVELDEKITPEQAEKYFRDPKVNKRYKAKIR